MVEIVALVVFLFLDLDLDFVRVFRGIERVYINCNNYKLKFN